MEGPYYGLPAFCRIDEDMTERTLCGNGSLGMAVDSKSRTLQAFPGIVNVNVPKEISLKTFGLNRSDLSQRRASATSTAVSAIESSVIST